MKLGKGGTMTDLDFDEIDKAVTSAMNNDDIQPDASENSSLPMVAEDNLPAVIEEPEEKPVEQLVEKSQPPAVRRTTGRIMDVVGPSKVKRDKKVVTPLAEKPNTPDELVDAAPTPFLPDANEKVEKRPLGAAAATGHASAFHSDPTSVHEAGSVPELGSADQPVGSDAPVPDELSKDLLSLDGSVETFETPYVAGTSPENTDSEQEETPETPAENPVQNDVPVPDVAPSIVQQYQEKQSSANEPTGAIYDTEAYHTPIKEPSKKKNVLFIILWILGLIIVGAGIGWALYAFVLPLL